MKIIQSAKFKVQNYNSKCKILILFLILSLLMLLQPINYNLQPAHAQTAACPTQATNPRVKEGLISASSISDNFSNPTGTCVEDPDKAPFVPYKIPSYADLKSVYYTQSKATTETNPAAVISNIRATDDQKVFNYSHTSSNVDITPAGLQYAGTAVIFIDGSLDVRGNIQSSDPTNKGLVLIVQGDVNIATSVTQIDAVIISEGTICTAYGTDCLDGSTITPQLTINGSLISLNESAPILFRRTLSETSNDDTPAEIINNEPKYLVILRNLMSDTLQKWSEIQ